MANEKWLIDVLPLMQNGWHLVKTGESNRFLASMSLADVPNVEAIEVVHGRWIKHGELDEDGNGQYHCSVCSAGESHNPIVDVPYCWKCGTKMDLEEND